MVQQTSGVKDLSCLVRYDDSSLAAIRHVQRIIPVVRPRPNIRSHSVLSFLISRAILKLLNVKIKRNFDEGQSKLGIVIDECL